jgi:hypothetical protein
MSEEFGSGEDTDGKSRDDEVDEYEPTKKVTCQRVSIGDHSEEDARVLTFYSCDCIPYTYQRLSAVRDKRGGAVDD